MRRKYLQVTYLTKVWYFQNTKNSNNSIKKKKNRKWANDLNSFHKIGYIDGK